MKLVRIFSFICILVLMSGCSIGKAYNQDRSSSVGYSVNEIEIASDEWTGIKEQEVSLREGDSLEFSLDYSYDDGEISVIVYSSEDEEVYNLNLEESKSYFDIPTSGEYKIEVIADKFNGKLVLSWNVET